MYKVILNYLNKLTLSFKLLIFLSKDLHNLNDSSKIKESEAKALLTAINDQINE